MRNHPLALARIVYRAQVCRLRRSPWKRNFGMARITLSTAPNIYFSTMQLPSRLRAAADNEFCPAFRALLFAFAYVIAPWLR